MNDIKDLEWLEIFLWYKCNVRCNFCYQKDLRFAYKENLSRDEVETLLRDGYNDGKRFVIFAWWEPTIDQNLIHYIEFSKEIGFQHIRIHTNGFTFDSYNYLENLFNKGLTGLIFSIHWFWKVHDEVTRVPWSFKKLQKGLENVEKLISKHPDFSLDINTVLYKWNYKTLLKLFIYLSRFPIIRCQLNYSSSLQLFSREEKEDLMVEYEKSLPYIQKILYISKKYGLKVVIDNIPYCLIWKPYFSFIEENIKNDRTSYLVTGEVKNTYAETYDSIKTEKCKKCMYVEKCSGIPTDYYELFSDTCLSPLYE